MSAIIPDLTSDEATGEGVISATRSRLSSKNEPGVFQTTVKISFAIADIDQARKAERMYPGAVELFRRAHGGSSDGKRGTDWTPVDPDVKLLINSKERGRILFEGSAETRKGVVRVTAKTAFIEQEWRLADCTIKDASAILEFLGEEVEIGTTQVNGALKFPSKSEDDEVEDGELPPEAGSIFPSVGNLITANVGGEVVHGLVREAVEEDGHIMFTEVGDTDGEMEALPEEVEAIVRICGAKGGTPDSVLKRYSAAARKEEGGDGPKAAHLIVAITQAVGRGLIEEREEGFPVTKDVIEIAVSLGRKDPQLAVV